MDSPRKFINLNTPIINFIKFLTVATSFILAAPVFADDCDNKTYADDYDSAFRICTKAAEQGEAYSQSLLGIMFSRGEGTPKDDKQALHWHTKAAEQGEASSQSHLGFIFYEGAGTPKDIIMAYVWFNVAAAQGEEIAKETRGLIEEEMTPNQIAEAQKLSKEYYAKYVK